MTLMKLSLKELKEKGGVNFHIATILKEPEWFQEKYGCVFETLRDDLDHFSFAPLQINETICGLHQYQSEKGEGTAVFVNREAKSKTKLLEDLINSFNLSLNDVSWRHASAGGILVRQFMEDVKTNLQPSRPLIQILTGPRQVGKTTGAKYIAANWKGKVLTETAEGISPKSEEWLVNVWAQASQNENTLLVIDEFQKVTNWASTIKFLWDKQMDHPNVKLLLLGSNSLFMDKHLTESLAGRYELTHVHHWNFEEYNAAFGTSLDDYLLFGGYPKAAQYIGKFDAWSKYISDSIVTPVVSVDIPSSSKQNSQKVSQFLDILGRHLGEVTPYSSLAHELPSNTNSRVIKEYIELFEGVFFFKRLKKITVKHLRRDSTPTLLPLFPSMISYFSKLDHFQDSEQKEKYLKAAVGQRLLGLNKGTLKYWREGKQEIDYIYEYNGQIFALQVCEELDLKKKKSIESFKKEFARCRSIQITESVFKSFSHNPDYFLESNAI